MRSVENVSSDVVGGIIGSGWLRLQLVRADRLGLGICDGLDGVVSGFELDDGKNGAKVVVEAGLDDRNILPSSSSAEMGRGFAVAKAGVRKRLCACAADLYGEVKRSSVFSASGDHFGEKTDGFLRGDGVSMGLSNSCEGRLKGVCWL